MSNRRNSKKKANNTVVKDENEKAETVSESVPEKTPEEKETPKADQAQAAEGDATLQQDDQTLVDEGQQDGEGDQQGGESTDTDLDNLKPAAAFTHEELDAMWYEPHEPSSPFPFVAVTKTKNGLDSFWRGGKQHFVKETVFPANTFTYDVFRRIFIEKSLSVQVVKPSNVN